ncbi:MAG: AtzG-like protein [Vicinamibacterales bacterium]
MDATHASPDSVDLSRRRLLQALAAAGVTGPLAARLAAQSGPRVTAETLRQAAALVGHELPPDRLAIVERALQRNLDQFQIVRDLVIDDLVEPAPVFLARTHAGPVTRPK